MGHRSIASLACLMRCLLASSSFGDDLLTTSRTIGDARVTVVSDGALWWAPQFPVPEETWRTAMPDADADGRVPLGLNVVLIEQGSARIVVDPGCDAPGARAERAMWGDAIVRTAGLDVALEALGWDPGSVTHVVVTHPHGDHIGGLTMVRGDDIGLRFPNARHYLGRDDWDDREAVLAFRKPLQAVAGAGLLELVPGELEIVPGVTLMPAPGETPGHQVVRVESIGETAWVLGDLFHHACEVEHPDWSPPHADARTNLATRLDLYPTLAGSGALVIAPHSPFPGWGHIREKAGVFRCVPA